MVLFVQDFSTKYHRCNQTSYNCHHTPPFFPLLVNYDVPPAKEQSVSVRGRSMKTVMTKTVGKQYYEGHTAEGLSPVWPSCAKSFYICVTWTQSSMQKSCLNTLITSDEQTQSPLNQPWQGKQLYVSMASPNRLSWVFMSVRETVRVTAKGMTEAGHGLLEAQERGGQHHTGHMVQDHVSPRDSV